MVFDHFSEGISGAKLRKDGVELVAQSISACGYEGHCRGTTMLRIWIPARKEGPGCEKVYE